MIVGMGIDIVDSDRFLPWLKDQSLMERYFSENEIAYVLSQKERGAPSLAARFAAKEALGKALGCGLKGIALKEIEVRRRKSGEPYLSLTGRAKQLVEAYSYAKVFLSLAHDKNMAIAQVIIEENQNAK